MGKTIEAGLVVKEKKLRGEIKRILLIVPKSAMIQWQQELKEHFNENFFIYDSDFITGMARTFASFDAEEELNFWKQHNQIIVSLDALKPVSQRQGWSQEKINEYNKYRIESVVGADFDMIIIDEAHRMGGSTSQVSRYQLAETLCNAVPNVLLLSATPHKGKSDHFRRVLQLMDTDAFSGEGMPTIEEISPYVMRSEKRYAVDYNGKKLFYWCPIKIDKDLDIEVPIADGPFSFKFRQDVKKEIAVNGNIFYDSYTNEIIDGKMIISINDFLILTLPLENKKEIKLEIKNHLNSLKSSIKEHDFLLAIHDAGELTINGFTIKLKINEKNNIEQIRQKVFQWKRLQKVLEILHVNKDLDLSSITEEQGQFIDILIDTFLNKNSISIEKKENTILLQEISNVKLLMYIYTNSEGKGVLGDFFDHRIDIRYQVNTSKTIKASPFSYLQNEDLWVKCDNIPYEMQISSYKNLGGDYEHIYELANLDLLSMIKAYDVVEKDDTHKRVQLSEAINNLDNWLLSTDKSDERHLIHTINHYQIIKRHRCYTEDEIDSIKSLYTNDEISMQIKVCLSLLLDDMQSFHTWYKNCTDSEKTQLKSWPIWRFSGASIQ